MMDNLAMLFRQIVPVRTEMTTGTIAGVVGVAANYFFGGWNDALEALIVLMIFDYISGILAAYINPNLALNSERGFKGIVKKVMILLIVALAHFIDRVLGQQIVCTMTIWFFFANEGLSIIENAAKAGLPLPARLKETLEQLTHEKQERAGEKK